MNQLENLAIKVNVLWQEVDVCAREYETANREIERIRADLKKQDITQADHKLQIAELVKNIRQNKGIRARINPWKKEFKQLEKEHENIPHIPPAHCPVGYNKLEAECVDRLNQIEDGLESIEKNQPRIADIELPSP